MYYILFMEFDYSKEKDALLIEMRGISFEDIIESIKEKGVLLDIPHPNKDKFPNQAMFIVNVDNYT